MPGARLPNIKKLTLGRDIQKRIIDFKERWHHSSLNRTPTDCDRVIDTISQLYRVCGEDPPLIVWCESPWQLTVLPAILDLMLSSYSHEQLTAHMHSKLSTDLKSQNEKLWKNLWRLLYQRLETIEQDDYLTGIGYDLNDRLIERRTKDFQNLSKELSSAFTDKSVLRLKQQISKACQRELSLCEGVKAQLLKEISCNTAAGLTGQFEFSVREKAQKFFKLLYLRNDWKVSVPAVTLDETAEVTAIGYGKRLIEAQHSQLVHQNLTNTATKIIWGEWCVDDLLMQAFAREDAKEFQWSKKRTAALELWSTLARETNSCLFFSKFCFIVKRAHKYSNKTHPDSQIPTTCDFSDTFSFETKVPVKSTSVDETESNSDEPAKTRQNTSRFLAFGAPIPTPIEIKEWLDKRVIGQQEAKKILAVAVYQHYSRVKNAKKSNNTKMPLPKSNILLVGPSGSGKTMLAQSLATMLSVPLVMIDITGISKTGYYGGNVEDMIRSLYHAANKNVAATQRGIIFIDEIDKVKASRDGSRDITGEGVQQDLLKLIEGKIVEIEENSTNGKKILIDTSNILFIASGAFSKIEQLVKERLNFRYGSSIGLTAKHSRAENQTDFNDLLKEVGPLDLIKFGLIPELVGRLPVIATLNELDVDSLIAIITQPRDSIFNQYTEMLKINGVKFELQPDAARRIAEEAHTRGTGARGLRAIFEKIMLDLMFELPSQSDVKKVSIDLQMVEKHLQHSKN